jgi:hypothetical protein
MRLQGVGWTSARRKPSRWAIYSAGKRRVRAEKRYIWMSMKRTGTGSHLSALAPEPTRSFLFPLLSHTAVDGSVKEDDMRNGRNGHFKVRERTERA